MGPEAKCRLCGAKIIYTPGNVRSLVEHFYKKHDHESVGYFSFENFETRTDKHKKHAGDFKEKKKKSFKTTVETWRQGPTCQTCPSCGRTDTPLIRKQRNKIARTPLGALCLLGCWPLCFLPFVLGGSDVMNLYCKHCGYFIATYDRRSGRVRDVSDSKKPSKVPKIC